jgi:hypothetical protein
MLERNKVAKVIADFTPLNTDFAGSVAYLVLYGMEF